MGAPEPANERIRAARGYASGGRDAETAKYFLWQRKSVMPYIWPYTPTSSTCSDRMRPLDAASATAVGSAPAKRPVSACTSSRRHGSVRNTFSTELCDEAVRRPDQPSCTPCACHLVGMRPCHGGPTLRWMPHILKGSGCLCCLQAAKRRIAAGLTRRASIIKYGSMNTMAEPRTKIHLRACPIAGS